MLDDVNQDDRKAHNVAGVKHGKAIISLEKSSLSNQTLQAKVINVIPGYNC